MEASLAAPPAAPPPPGPRSPPPPAPPPWGLPRRASSRSSAADFQLAMATNQVLGLSPHSDAVGLTLLLQVSLVPGMQIRREDGAWISLEPLPGPLVANVGDVLEVLTNGRYKSIEHRAVVNARHHRVSMAAFHSAKFDATYAPLEEIVIGAGKAPRYRTITAASCSSAAGAFLAAASRSSATGAPLPAASWSSAMGASLPASSCSSAAEACAAVHGGKPRRLEEPIERGLRGGAPPTGADDEAAGLEGVDCENEGDGADGQLVAGSRRKRDGGG